MPKKPSKELTASIVQRAFGPAIEKADVRKVRELLASGLKPNQEAARQAVDACIKASSTARQTTRPLFGRMPSKKEQEKAAADAGVYYDIAEALLKAGAPAPEALCPAARSGHTQLALLLIRHGADVDYDPPMGTPLENAVSAGNLEVVRALIKAGADIHHQGIKGTLLHRAIEQDHVGIATELIKAGVDINAQPKIGSTALLRAVTERKGEFVPLLLAAGANVNQKGTVLCGDFGEPEVEEEGMFRTTHIPNPPVARQATPLIVATRRGYADIATQLLAGGADVEAVDAEGFTAFVYASKAGDEPLLKLLKEAGAKAPKYAEGSREAAWIAAAKAGDCARLRALLDEGIEVNLKYASQDEPEGTALTHAAENGRLDAVKLLLKAGAKANEKVGFGCDVYQQTALMSAAKAGHVDVAKTLLDAGAIAWAKDGSGTTVLHYAAEGGQSAVIELLLKAGAQVEVKNKSGLSPLMTAASEGRSEVVKSLLKAGADPNRFTHGMTALYYAASGGHAAVVKLLLDAGADIKAGGPTFSPLEGASSEGHKEVVDLLLKAEPRPNKRGSGKTSMADGAALSNAALMGQVEIVRTLLESGADPNCAGEEHFTPLMGAVRSGAIEIVKMLLSAGADVNALNEQRETALDLAYDNIKAAKDQAKFLKMMSGDDMDAETREAIRIIKAAGNEDELTEALKKAGGKRAKELKGKKAPRSAKEERKPKKPSDDLETPDFGERAKAPEFLKAIDELARIAGHRPKPVSNEEDQPMVGCVKLQLPSETADRILKEHHRAFLGRGCYLLKSNRGYTSGKDELTLLPTANRAEVLAAFQTNGANFEVYPQDVVQWLDELEKSQPFVLTGVGFDWCEGTFTKPLVDSKKLAKKMYEFCPDIVDQGTGDVSRLALELKKTQRFFFWWD
jgi:ankyrin repeat protein